MQHRNVKYNAKHQRSMEMLQEPYKTIQINQTKVSSVIIREHFYLPNFMILIQISITRFLLNFTTEKRYITKIPHCFKVSIIQALNWKCTDLFRKIFSLLFACCLAIYNDKMTSMKRRNHLNSRVKGKISHKTLISLFNFVSTTNTNETGSLLAVMVIAF